jgi:beta-galactosidase
MGVRSKDPSALYTKYRLVWDQVPYEAGELKVVAFDASNKPVKEQITRTAGKPSKIVMKADRNTVSHDSKELAFVTAVILDSKGVECPKAANKITFSVEGNGKVKATDNGDPTCLESFVSPVRSAFNGKCIAILQSTAKGQMKLIATSPGLGDAEVKVRVE